jgi:hypothetical protein
LHKDHGPEEVVVDPGELQRSQGSEGGQRQGHDDLRVLLPDPGAVDPGGFVQRLRQELHVVAEDEGAKAALECDVDQDQPQEASIELARTREKRRRQVDVVVELKERLDDDLLREEVAGGEDHQQRDVEPPRIPTADERDHAREPERE